MNDLTALLHQQIQNLTTLHALNKMMDEELNLLIEDARAQLNTTAEQHAEHWYSEKDAVKAEHHKHQARHDAKTVKHNLMKTVHAYLHGQVDLHQIHPEHSLDRLHAKLRKHLKEEKKQLHKKISETHKKLQIQHKKLPQEEFESFSALLQKTKQLQEHIKNKTLSSTQIEEQLHSLPVFSVVKGYA